MAVNATKIEATFPNGYKTGQIYAMVEMTGMPIVKAIDDDDDSVIRLILSKLANMHSFEGDPYTPCYSCELCRCSRWFC